MQTWTLKKAPESNAILAKLPEGISIENQKVLYMYHQDEDIQEKDTIDPEENKIAFIRKKRRRRSLKSKSLIRLEELPKGNQMLDFERVNLEGSLIDSSLEGMSSSKYALLQVVKKNGAVDPADMTINVILVGNTYHFKHIVASRVEKSLEELDNEYDKQLRQQKETNKRYNRISSALTRSDPNADEGEEVDGGYSNPFGTSGGRKKGGGGGSGGGGRKADTFRGHMNDGGQDVDEERNFDEFNGVGLEYEGQVSDDEDDAELLQGVDAEREENDVDGGDIFEEDENDSDSSSEAADDEEEEETDPMDSKDRALQQASSELSDYLSTTKSLSPSSSSSSTTTSSLPSTSVSLESGVIVVDRSGGFVDNGSGSAGGEGNIEKRKESPTDLTPDEERSKKRKVGSGSSSGGALTEELVRQTIMSMGGRVAAKNLAQELKKPIKKMGEAGKTRFREIVVKITQSEDDAVFGKVLVLKK